MFKNSNSFIRINTNAHSMLDYINKRSNLKKWVPLVDVKNYAEYFHSEPYKRLIDQGLILTKRDPNDKRRNLVRITVRGKQVIKLLNKKL